MGEFCKTTVLPLNQTYPLLHFINVNVSVLMDVCHEIESSESESATQAKYSEPMWAIGYYIFGASAICSGLMIYDVIFGIITNFRMPRFFSLNAVSITLIAVCMKLPMDLSTPMSNEADQVAKVGSLGFMCIMMTHLMPSMASMDNNSLLANVTGLSILVITLIVNVGIQIKTQVITHESLNTFSMPPFIVAYIYMSMLIFLQIMFISYAITIPALKNILELKYQAILNDQNPQANLKLTVEELRNLLKRYSVMAEASELQYLITPLTSTTSVMCVINMVVYFSFLWHTFKQTEEPFSVYGYATDSISKLQVFVVGIGALGSIYKCFMDLRFKLFAYHNNNHSSVFVVENYWTKILSDWKETPLVFPSLRINLEVEPFIQFKNIIFSTCIIFQKLIVLLCKIIEFIPLKAMLFTPPALANSEDIDRDLKNYVLSLEDDVQVTKYSLQRGLVSMKRCVWILEKRKPPHKNLLKLLEKSISFEGVRMFDNDQIQNLLTVELVNSWSLPIISLTCIAIAIPNIGKDEVDNLLKSVSEGLSFTHTVEESLNVTKEDVYIRRGTTTLWRKVENKRKWLDTTLKVSAYEGKIPKDILESFDNVAKEILNEFKNSINGVYPENLPLNVFAANTMYRVSQTIMHRYENNLEIIEGDLFSQLSTIIADLLAACFTNIPRVIVKKCQDAKFEKLKGHVLDAFRFLEETSDILQELETRDMDPDRRAYIGEWRLRFRQP